MLRTVCASRYVLPFREGSSVPALVEADDLGFYVMKLRGAAQGPKALIAELLAGELARATGLAVPELVLVELDRAIAECEPDPELALPLEASVGLNLGLDFLPGSITFDPLVGPTPDATLCSRIVLFDAFITNVDRTARNPNLLRWHDRIWLIDHGASLYFHYGWSAANPLESSRDPFTEVSEHVLLPWASQLEEAASHLTRTLSESVMDELAARIPDSWLLAQNGWDDAPSQRRAYRDWLVARAASLPLIVEEAERARASRI